MWSFRVPTHQLANANVLTKWGPPGCPLIKRRAQIGEQVGIRPASVVTREQPSEQAVEWSRSLARSWLVGQAACRPGGVRKLLRAGLVWRRVRVRVLKKARRQKGGLASDRANAGGKTGSQAEHGKRSGQGERRDCDRRGKVRNLRLESFRSWISVPLSF